MAEWDAPPGGGGADGATGDNATAGGSGGDGSDDSALPDIVQFLMNKKGLVKRFFTDPVGFVMSVVLGWVVGKFVDAWTWTLDAAIAASQSVIWAQFTILDAYISPFFIVAGSFQDLILAIQQWNIAIASGTGPLAPAVALLLIAGEAFLFLVLVDFAIRSGVIGGLGSLPVVGTAFTAIGQAYVAAKDFIARLREVMFPE